MAASLCQTGRGDDHAAAERRKRRPEYPIYDNAMLETVFKTMKSELIWRTIFSSRRQAEIAIGRYIDGFYNPRRRHSALGYQSPCAFEAAV